MFTQDQLGLRPRPFCRRKGCGSTDCKLASPHVSFLIASPIVADDS
jgi:hypothetical protein